MQSTRHQWFLAGRLLLVTLPFLMSRDASSQQRLLLPQATKIADTSLWDRRLPYEWISNHEVFYLLDQPGTLAIVTNQGIVANQLDLRTKTEKGRVVFNDLERWAGVSPRAKWVLLELVHTSGTFTSAVKSDGTMEHQIAFGDVLDLHWMSDGHHWVEFFKKSRSRTLAIVHDVEDLSQVKRIWSKVKGLAEVANTEFTSKGLLLQVRSLDATTRGPHTKHFCEIVEARMGRQITLLHRYRVRLPSGLLMGTGLFSPQGDRVLWWLYTRVKTRTGTHVTCCLWVSRLNGSHMHEIGRLEQGQSADEQIQHVTWLPDGQYASFLYRKALWKVAVR